MAGDDSMTVLEVIKSATGFLQKNGVDDARLNAEHLLAHALGKKKRLDLYLEFDRPLSRDDRAPLRDLVRERASGRPLQHLLGTAEFFGREFLCDARALVPRPETEQLVELVKSKIQNPKSKILDVGTGSGVIAITLALELPGAEVTALDISPDALDLARANAEKLDAKLTLEPGDLLPAGPPAAFDLIVANLPYIPAAEIPALAREVRHDPVRALDGGPDGLDLVRALIERAVPHLAPGGGMFLEIGFDQAARVAEIFERNGYREVVIAKDYQGVERFVAAAR